MTGHGFIAPEYIKPEERLFGASVFKEINPSGNWEEYMLRQEQQRKRIETYACTAFGTTSQIEALLNFRYGLKTEWSPRALGIIAGISPPGANPHTILDHARKEGLLEDVYLQFDESIETVEEYYSPKPLPHHLEKRMNSFVKIYQLWHEWTFTPFYSAKEKTANILKALRSSPVGVSVYSSGLDATGYFHKNEGDRDDHWTVIKRADVIRRRFIVFDSYEGEKELPFDYPFEFAKTISVELLGEVEVSVWEKIKDLFKTCRPSAVTRVGQSRVEAVQSIQKG